MKEAGYEKGFTVVFLTPNASNRLRATEMVQQQLKEINITGDLQSMDVASFYNKLESQPGGRCHACCRLSLSADGLLPRAMRTGASGPCWRHRDFRPALSNFGFFSDKKVDELIQAGLVSADPEVRAGRLRQGQDTVWPMAPWGYLFVDTLMAAKVKNLKGVYPMADGSFSVEDAELTVNSGQLPC